jgi:serine phosphatase RsbU (regulator of sigma subunit)
VKLKAIYEISQAIAQTLDMDQIFEKILDTAFRIFPQADRGLVIQPDVTGRFVPRSSKQRREDEDTIRFSKTVVQRAMEEKKAILSADASSDERFSMSESIADFRIRSVMCVPLLGVDQRSLGVIQLDTQSYTQRFSEDDLQVLTSVANQAAIAMENARLHEEMLIQERMRRELSFAREVQQGFLPRFMPKVNGYEFWGFYEAAGLIGGDYYDFVQLPEGRQAVIVADVSGKGVPAALLMARFSSDAKVSLLTHPNNLALAVSHLNRTLCDAGLDDRFVTMAVSVIDPVKHLVQVVNAGHMSPMVRHRDGTIAEPANVDGSACLPLGILPDAAYYVVEFSLAVGEEVVTYSDGINESMNVNNQQYSSERLRERLQALSLPATKLGEALVADVREFSAGRSQHDDMTLVVFSRTA